MAHENEKPKEKDINVHTHRVGYEHSDGWPARERHVTHKHEHGSEPHSHTSFPDLVIGPDYRILGPGPTATPNQLVASGMSGKTEREREKQATGAA